MNFLDKIKILTLQHFPKSLFSDSMNQIAKLNLPKSIKPQILKMFVRFNKINMAESEYPLDHYKTLDELFTRKLKKELRPIDLSSNCIVSPVDGKIQNLGKIQNKTLIQAKNIDYSLDKLLGNSKTAEYFNQGNYLTIYLSPKDYHRVHFPLEGTVKEYTHISGVSYPVGKFSSQNIPELYTLNERIIIYVDTQYGKYALIMVAAMGVGNMTLSFTENPNEPVNSKQNITTPIEKGSEAGIFHLGSTVIILTPPNFTKIDLHTEEIVRIGQKIGNLQLA